MEFTRERVTHPSTFLPKPLQPLLLPRHSHPGASDSHASPRCGSVDRLHVLPCARSRGGSSRHHRAHHPGGGSGLPGLPASLHARFVPHLGDGRVVEKGFEVRSAAQLFVSQFCRFSIGRYLKRKEKGGMRGGEEKSGRANSALLLHHHHHRRAASAPARCLLTRWRERALRGHGGGEEEIKV